MEQKRILKSRIDTEKNIFRKEFKDSKETINKRFLMIISVGAD